MLRFATIIIMLSSLVSGQTCGNAWKTAARVENATLTDYMSAVEVDRVENGCTASVALETFVLRKSTESPAFVKLHVVFRVERQSNRNAGHPRKLPDRENTVKPKEDIVVPDTVDLTTTTFLHRSFNPQKMTYTPCIWKIK
jgi:hypothetical protein